MTADRSLEAYFAESSAWDADRVARAARSARVAWWVAGAAGVCAVAAIAALALLTPLKRVEPFVLRVDRTTGIVDVVPVYAGRGRFAEPVTRYFLSHYVTVCERFDYATAQSDYAQCGAFNSGPLNAALYALWNTSNPASPLNGHKDGSTVRAEVTSVSFLGHEGGLESLAQVRYLKETRTTEGTVVRTTHWIATLRYAYGTPPKDPKVRRFNPLGFRVLDFHAEPEVFDEAAEDAAAAEAVPRSGATVASGGPR